MRDGGVGCSGEVDLFELVTRETAQGRGPWWRRRGFRRRWRVVDLVEGRVGEGVRANFEGAFAELMQGVVRRRGFVDRLALGGELGEC